MPERWSRCSGSKAMRRSSYFGHFAGMIKVDDGEDDGGPAFDFTRAGTGGRRETR